MMSDAARPQRYVSRAGLKLEAALHGFGLDIAGCVCIDFGSHTGGFVDCLLQHGAARVYAVDPGYGVLNYKLRRDARVVVCERRNALRFEPPEPADLVTIDVGWTPQRMILPAARRCLKEGARGILTLIKPQYEAEASELRSGVVADECLDAVLRRCRDDIRALHMSIRAEVQSPLEGHGGNREFVWWLTSEPRS
ncbi:Hemolysin A [Phycisphaerae bacterium RAS1]|nr:Hemolysin A [Phycisphaerae bacterium RAS1]